MTSRLKKELLQLQLQRTNKDDDALVFEHAKVNLRKLWTAAYAQAGVPKGTRLFYAVRHNFGTEMANEGMPLPALANLLGHCDVKMTMRYYNMNKKTIDKLATFSTGGQWSIAKEDPREALISSLIDLSTSYMPNDTTHTQTRTVVEE
jgi:hypothetical protein